MGQVVSRHRRRQSLINNANAAACYRNSAAAAAATWCNVGNVAAAAKVLVINKMHKSRKGATAALCNGIANDNDDCKKVSFNPETKTSLRCWKFS